MGDDVREEREALVPMDQATVTLYGHEIVAVRLLDGRIGAVFSSLCEALQLDRGSQLRRVQDDEILVDQLLLTQVATAGGAQSVNVLTAWAIPVWLQGVQLKRLTEEKRAAILAFKREAADVLYKHFSQRTALPAPANLVPSEPIEQPIAPGSGAPPAEWLAYHQQMVSFLQWQSDIEQWRGSMESRLESVEEISRLVPEILERLGPQTLSTAHQSTVQVAVKRLHEASGAAFSTIYSELNRDFHVGKYTEIPEAQWSEVADWFKKRLDAAAKRKSSRGPAAEATTLFPTNE